MWLAFVIVFSAIAVTAAAVHSDEKHLKDYCQHCACYDEKGTCCACAIEKSA